MKKLKFKTPVSMVVENENIEQLKKGLKELGYSSNYLCVKGDGKTLLYTNAGGNSNFYSLNSRVTNLTKNVMGLSEGQHFISNYNPELFLALAAMTDEEDWVVGEWVVDHYIGNHIVFKCEYLEGCNWRVGCAGNNFPEYYRKATKEELIKHFNKETMKIGNRFPFQLSPENAARIIDIACSTWKKKLAIEWGTSMALGEDNKITEGKYKQMREACDSKQHELFDDIFGRDKFIEKGKACLVSDDKSDWGLRYSDGKGGFYNSGKKEGLSNTWSYVIELDSDPTEGYKQ